MTRPHIYTLVIFLTFIGVALFSYKIFFLKFPLQPLSEEDTWQAEVRISFRAKNTPSKISLYIPRMGGTYSAVDEQFISPGFGINIRKSDGNRQAVWSAPRVSGTQFLYFRTIIRSAADYNEASTQNPPKVVTPNFEDAMQLAANTLLANIQINRTDKTTLISELIKRFGKKPLENNITVLLNKKKSTKNKLVMITKLLALIGIPARVVNGFRLEQFTRDAKLMHWLEVYQQGHWRPYDSKSGAPLTDLDILPWWHGQEELVYVTEGRQVKSKVSMKLHKETAILGAMWREQQIRPALYKYSLLGLPIETQVVYQTLLTVPVGVFLLLLLRNIIGIKTIGTFTPVLIALAFREIPLLWGILLFSLVIVLGLAVRFYFERLNLLRVSRLTAVLIVVVILTSLISVVSYHFGIYQGLSVTLLPMVILAMTIERISVAWEKRGAMEAFQRGLGSLFVAITAFVVMDLDIVKHIVLMFPELLLIILATTILLGCYSGYSLPELIRTKTLAGDKK